MISHSARHTPSLVLLSAEDELVRKIGMISPRIRSPNFLHNSPMVLEAV